MRLQSGLHLGPYEVLGFIGAGGMAEVYRAQDTRLARDVALKMVTEALSSDPDLIRRHVPRGGRRSPFHHHRGHPRGALA